MRRDGPALDFVPEMDTPPSDPVTPPAAPTRGADTVVTHEHLV